MKRKPITGDLIDDRGRTMLNLGADPEHPHPPRYLVTRADGSIAVVTTFGWQGPERILACL